METVNKPIPCIFLIMVKNSHKSMFKKCVYIYYEGLYYSSSLNY